MQDKCLRKVEVKSIWSNTQSFIKMKINKIFNNWAKIHDHKRCQTDITSYHVDLYHSSSLSKTGQ